MKYQMLLAALLLVSIVNEACAQEVATLRVIGRPKGVKSISPSGQSYLSSVEVEVMNVGQIPAQMIQVIATLPSGERVLLEGPKNIESNDRSLYTKKIKVLNPPRQDILAEVRCANCRNR